MMWISLLPSPIRRKIVSKEHLPNIITNAAWLFADRILRMTVGLFVAVWVARYLGPERYGVLNYAMAFVSLFSAIAGLGLDSIVVRNIVREPGRKDEILGTAFCMMLAAGAVSLAVSLAVISALNRGDRTTFLLVSIIAAGFVFQSFNAIDYWFQSQVRSKYTVYAQNGAFLLANAAKVIMILSHAPLAAFAAAALTEVLLAAAFLVLAYHGTRGRLRAWHFNAATGRSLLRDSWPLILSSIMIVVYMRIDQIMIGKMLTSRDVGIYSVAVKLAELWYFVPTAVVSSVFPAIINAKARDEGVYHARLQRLYSLMTWMGIVFSLCMLAAGERLIVLLFGAPYRESSSILMINMWAGIFVAQGVARGRWMIVENLQRYSFWYIGAGALMNVVLNLFLVPRLGSPGAALSTLLAQATVSIIAPALFTETRISSIMLLKSFFPSFLFWSREETTE